MNTAEYLLRRMIEVVEEQVNAAKKIDIKTLQDATERRQDLLFQLEIERESQIYIQQQSYRNCHPSCKLLMKG